MVAEPWAELVKTDPSAQTLDQGLPVVNATDTIGGGNESRCEPRPKPSGDLCELQLSDLFICVVACRFVANTGPHGCILGGTCDSGRSCNSCAPCRLNLHQVHSKVHALESGLDAPKVNATTLLVELVPSPLLCRCLLDHGLDMIP